MRTGAMRIRMKAMIGMVTNGREWSLFNDAW